MYDGSSFSIASLMLVIFCVSACALSHFSHVQLKRPNVSLALQDSLLLTHQGSPVIFYSKCKVVTCDFDLHFPSVELENSVGNWGIQGELGNFPSVELPLEKAMAPHSSTLAWRIPWMAEPGRLQSMGSLRVGHDWTTSLSLFPFMHWRRKWQPTPVFLPGEAQGWGSLVGCCLWGRTESDTTEVT